MKKLLIALFLFPVTLVVAVPSAKPRLGEAPVRKIVAAMSLEEKAGLLVGTSMEGYAGEGAVTGRTLKTVPGSAGTTRSLESYGIPTTVMADGPAGLRIDPERAGDARTYFCTAFPIGTMLASTWDEAAIERCGAAMGNEVLEYGCDVILGPGMNIHRHPLCGRNFEYYSEDPLLSGKCGAAMVRGIQSQGVGTSVKHFAANNQESMRLQNDARVSQRALREIYLRGFEIAVKEGRPWTVMSSYNRINGPYTQESRELLTTVLHDEWGYEGLVVSDWIGKRNTVAQVHAGNDLMMPGEPAQAREIVEAVRSGRLAEADVDRCVTRVLEYILRTPRSGNKPCRRLPTWKHMLPYRVRWQRKAWFCSATKALLYHLPQDVISRCSESMPMTALPEVRAPDTSTKPIRSIWTKVCATPDSGLTPVRQISMQNTCLSVRHCSRSRTPCVIWAKSGLSPKRR